MIYEIIAVLCIIIVLSTVLLTIQSVMEVGALRAAIRKHRDYRGDDRCWLDDRELYSVLPEGYVPPTEDSAVEIENCYEYIARRHDPDIEYVSPQRKIEELEKELEKLRKALNEQVGLQGKQ